VSGAEHLVPKLGGRQIGTGADHQNAGAGSLEAASSGKRRSFDQPPALFPDNYSCPGGCGGSGFLLDPQADGTGRMVACEECNPGAAPIVDPEYAELPF
jgi:hypothetical protein